MSHTLVNKYPDPDRPEIKFPDPTLPDPKILILKNVPRPRTGFGPVPSGPGKLGVWVAPQFFSWGQSSKIVDLKILA